MQPVLEDSRNTFFYLYEVVLQNNENAASYVQPVRLAGNNLAEAWDLCLFTSAFGMIHVEPIVGSCSALGAVLGIFLLPMHSWHRIYSSRSFKRQQQQQSLPSSSISSFPKCSGKPKKNPIVSTMFAGIASLVSLTALVQCTTVATAADWTEFGSLVQADRTYLTFCVSTWCSFPSFSPWF